jgi:glycosyltransferase involved in cell wall biosynthesis
MIPEVLGFDLTAKDWMEKQSAISFAWYYACISQNTRADLKRFYPSIGDDRASVVYCGVDHNVFRPRRLAATVRQGRQRGRKPYYMLVGARHQHTGYKNADLLIEAFRRARIGGADILCVGGEPEIPADWHRGLPASVSIRRVEMADEELADAYAGAEALVYPSLYEGFGLPVLEAMACGCPVIAARRGSLGEIAAGAACYIGGTDADELARAMVKVRDDEYRSRLIGLGLEQASRFSWSRAAEGLVELFQRAIEERSSAGAAAFFREWRRLRMIQAEVDTGLP